MKGPYCVRTKQGLCVWETERLWELTRNFPVQNIPLESLSALDEVRWFHRQGSDPKPTCKAVAIHARMIYEADLAYPIILSAQGDVMDGMHRIAKAWLLGLGEIKAVRFQQDPEPDRIIPSESRSRFALSKRLSALVRKPRW